MKSTLSIGEVASASGLRTSALRYYEERGLVKPVARQAGRRRYDQSVLRRLAIIALFQRVGFTVREIGKLLGEGRQARNQWRTLAENKLVELVEHLNQTEATKNLLEAVLACGCGDPANCEMVATAFEPRLHQIASVRPQRA